MERRFSMIQYQISNFNNNSLFDIAPQMYLNRMSFILISNLSIIDIDCKPPTAINPIRTHDNQISIFLHKATFALIMAIDPIKCDSSTL